MDILVGPSDFIFGGLYYFHLDHVFIHYYEQGLTNLLRNLFLFGIYQLWADSTEIFTFLNSFLCLPIAETKLGNSRLMGV